MPVNRHRLLSAVRERMRRHPSARRVEDAPAPPPRPIRPRPPAPDHELDQLAAEARYSRERFDLYRARVISGSSAATSPARLRELERTATAAAERLAAARRARPERDG